MVFCAKFSWIDSGIVLLISYAYLDGGAEEKNGDCQTGQSLEACQALVRRLKNEIDAYLVIQFIYFSDIQNIFNTTPKFKNISFQMRTSIYNEDICSSTNSNATDTKNIGTVVTNCQLCLNLKLMLIWKNTIHKIAKKKP